MKRGHRIPHDVVTRAGCWWVMTPPKELENYPVVFLYDRKTRKVRHALIVTVREIFHCGVDKNGRYRKDYDLNLVMPDNQNSALTREVLAYLKDICDPNDQCQEISWRIDTRQTLHGLYREAYASQQSLNLIFKPGVTVASTPNVPDVEELIDSLNALAPPTVQPATGQTPAQQAPHRLKKARESEAYIKHLMKGKDE